MPQPPPIKLSAEKLVSAPWTFSPAGDMLVEGNFRFAASGAVDLYRNDNEHRWLVEDGVLRVLRRDGSLMWESGSVTTSGAGLEIAVTSPLDASLHFVFRECGADGRVIHNWSQTLSAARFLFPNDLQVTPSDVRRVLMIGSCLSERFLEFTRQDRPDVAFDFILFNYAGELPGSLPAPASEYDFQYIQIPLRSVVTDRVIHAVQLNSAAFVEGILADGCAIIDAMLDSALVYTREHGLPAFVSNFLVPQTNLAASVRQRGTRHDLGHIVARLNEHLAEAVQRHPNTYLCDTDTLAASFGKRFFLDDVVAFSSHGSILRQERYDMQPHARIERVPEMNTFYETRWREFFQAMFEQAVATFRTIRQMDQVKAVVFDLDHTLWRGQIAEDYRSDAESFPPHSEWQLGLWDAVHHLRARGILVAICSKNDLDTVKANWGNVVHPPFIALEDFAAVRINWEPKSENIRAICADFNIKPRSVVFVDDNPIEREAVRAALPDVRVIGSNPYLTRRILLWSPETQVAHLSEESAGREEAIRGQIVREDTRTSLSRAEFLQTLGCEVTFLAVREPGQAEFARALELTNKTNQFNTTGRRWTAAGIQEFLRDGGDVLAFRVKDRFAEYGLVGVVYARHGLVEQMVMSCRVLGMEIEQCAVARVVAGMAARDPGGAVTAQLRETPDNGPCREVFQRLGFEEGERDGDMRRFALDPSRTVAMPSHITVLGDAAATRRQEAGVPSMADA
ncbi:MAG: HAD-IIIC family phosphatase [Janthinobacterium lividum]